MIGKYKPKRKGSTKATGRDYEHEVAMQGKAKGSSKKKVNEARSRRNSDLEAARKAGKAPPPRKGKPGHAGMDGSHSEKHARGKYTREHSSINRARKT